MDLKGFCIAIAVFAFVVGIYVAVKVLIRWKKPPRFAYYHNETNWTIGAYYYPWYTTGKFYERGVLRNRLVPPQDPVLGDYDSREYAVIEQHLVWSQEAAISLWVTSWWGPGKATDVILRNHVLTHSGLGTMKLAVHYETLGRTNQLTDLSSVGSDIRYLAKYYFHHTNYYHIDGRPVIFLYLTRSLSKQSLLNDTIAAMRSAASSSGVDLYIVGDHIYGKVKMKDASLGALTLLDGATTYDVYGSIVGGGYGGNTTTISSSTSGDFRYYAGQEAIDTHHANQKKWRDLCQASNALFIPGVTPGYNDRALSTRAKMNRPPLSRKMNQSSEHGSLFSLLVSNALSLLNDDDDDSSSTTKNRLLLVTSFNEWYEDTQIEPVVGCCHGTTNLDSSTSGRYYTSNLTYEEYGTKYLEILQDAHRKLMEERSLK